jgi:hypothetical protein
MDEMDRSVVITVEPAGSHANWEQQPADRSAEKRRLATQFLMGLLLLGSDELLRYLQAAQNESGAAPKIPTTIVSGKETGRDRAAYLALGALTQGQKRLGRGIRRGVRYAESAVGWAFATMDRLTDNPLGYLVRRPIERRLDDLVREGERVVREGRQQAQSARLLASRTLGVMARDVVAEVADSPEVTEAIQEIVGQQGGELTATMMDDTRQASAVTDSRLESVVRRLFRRRPRREVSPSPLAGKPQTMYLSWDQTQEGGRDGR